MNDFIYCTYILANNKPMLYTGITNNLVRRLQEHKLHFHSKSFTARYNIHKLVYFEAFETPLEAIIREKQIKDMNRDEKLALVRKVNPTMRDLSEEL